MAALPAPFDTLPPAGVNEMRLLWAIYKATVDNGSGGGGGSTTQPTGAANVNVAQIATSTTAATLAIARPTRTGLLVRNLDTSISVYIGPATVTAGNGMLLKAGESVPVTWVGLWQVIAASGTPTVAIVDEYS